MSTISQIVKTQAPKSYGLGVQHQAFNKQLGPQGGGDTSSDLGAWYNAAWAYYNSVQSGQEPQPDASAWQDFLNQMNWAYQQLWGNAGASGDWGNSLQPGMEPGAEEETPDPSGAMKGPNGNYILNEEKNEVGFIGGGRVYDMWGPYNTIHIAPYSATVTVVKSTDDSINPPGEVILIKVVDGATGEESTYRIHDVETLEELNILAANMDKVDIQVEDERIKLGKFEKGGMAEGGGIPEGGEIDDGVGHFEGMMGSWTEFQPPFGNLKEIYSYGDTDISVRSSDEVLVELLDDGNTRVTVTDRDGEVVSVITVDAGSKMNINAKEDHVTFKEGSSNGHTPGGLDLAAAGAGNDGPKRTNPVDPHQVPSGEKWEHVSLNGQGAPVEEPEAVNPGSADWPDEFIDLLDEMGIDWETQAVELPDQIKELIENGLFTYNTKAMKDLLDVLADQDGGLKSALEALEKNDTKGNWNLVRDRLLELLNTAFGNKLSPLSKSDLPEDLELSDKELAQYFQHDNGTVYRIKLNDNGKIRLEEVDLENIEGESNTSNADMGPYGEARAEEFHEQLVSLADVLGLTYEELYDKIANYTTQQKGDLWHILDYTTQRNFTPDQLPRLFSVLAELDPGLEQALNSFQGKNASDAAYAQIRDRLIPLLQVLYPNAGIAAGNDNDNILFFGENFDVIDQDNGNHDWLHWKKQ